VWTTHGDSEPEVENWPPLLPEPYQAADLEMDVSSLAQFWKGSVDSDYALASVTGTMAVALKAMGKADSVETAQALAEKLWSERDRDFIPVKA